MESSSHSFETIKAWHRCRNSTTIKTTSHYYSVHMHTHKTAAAAISQVHWVTEAVIVQAR